MEEETEEFLNNRARRIFEPRYGRKLSDKEVAESIRNFVEYERAFIDLAEDKKEADSL